MKGQGLVEYALIFVWVAIAIIVLIAIGANIVGLDQQFRYEKYQECIRQDYDKEFCAVRWAK